jgi:hypothetical protein
MKRGKGRYGSSEHSGSDDINCKLAVKLKKINPQAFSKFEEYGARVFKEYYCEETNPISFFVKHDKQHITNVLAILSDLLCPILDLQPEIIDANEILMLLTSCLLHDIGAYYCNFFPYFSPTYVRKYHGGLSAYLIADIDWIDYTQKETIHIQKETIEDICKAHQSDFDIHEIEDLRTRLLATFLQVADGLDVNKSRIGGRKILETRLRYNRTQILVGAMNAIASIKTLDLKILRPVETDYVIKSLELLLVEALKFGETISPRRIFDLFIESPLLREKVMRKFRDLGYDDETNQFLYIEDCIVAVLLAVADYCNLNIKPSSVNSIPDLFSFECLLDGLRPEYSLIRNIALCNLIARNREHCYKSFIMQKVHVDMVERDSKFLFKVSATVSLRDLPLKEALSRLDLEKYLNRAFSDIIKEIMLANRKFGEFEQLGLKGISFEESVRAVIQRIQGKDISVFFEKKEFDDDTCIFDFSREDFDNALQRASTFGKEVIPFVNNLINKVIEKQRFGSIFYNLSNQGAVDDFRHDWTECRKEICREILGLPCSELKLKEDTDFRLQFSFLTSLANTVAENRDRFLNNIKEFNKANELDPNGQKAGEISTIIGKIEENARRVMEITQGGPINEFDKNIHDHD